MRKRYIEFCLNWKQCNENILACDIFAGCLTSIISTAKRDSLESVLRTVITSVFSKLPSDYDRIPNKDSMPYCPSKSVFEIRLQMINELVQAIAPLNLVHRAMGCLTSLEVSGFGKSRPVVFKHIHLHKQTYARINAVHTYQVINDVCCTVACCYQHIRGPLYYVKLTCEYAQICFFTKLRSHNTVRRESSFCAQAQLEAAGWPKSDIDVDTLVNELLVYSELKTDICVAGVLLF